jgi:prevent-host-death family protein
MAFDLIIPISRLRPSVSLRIAKSFDWCYYEIMQTFSANQAKTQFGQFIDLAQREPVRVVRHDRVVGVMVSAQDYEAMQNFYANRLQHTLARTAAQAQARGLTPDQLDRLLRDES